MSKRVRRMRCALFKLEKECIKICVLDLKYSI